MNVAIVGSRRRTDKDKVIEYVLAMDPNDTVVSGGCEGVDSWAIETAQSLGMKWKVFLPDMSNVKTYYDRCNRYYERNERVVKASDMVVAFVAKDRKGGTENTIKWARKLGKVIIIINEAQPDGDLAE